MIDGIGLESGQLPISDGPKEEAYRKHQNAYNIRRSQGVRLRMADRFEHREGDDPQDEGLHAPLRRRFYVSYW